jgi:hypothetical protein
VRQPGEARERPAAEVEAENWASCGVCSSASEQISVRSAVDLPLRGAPTTAA